MSLQCYQFNIWSVWRNEDIAKLHFLWTDVTLLMVVWGLTVLLSSSQNNIYKRCFKAATAHRQESDCSGCVTAGLFTMRSMDLSELDCSLCDLWMCQIRIVYYTRKKSDAHYTSNNADIRKLMSHASKRNLCIYGWCILTSTVTPSTVQYNTDTLVTKIFLNF